MTDEIIVPKRNWAMRFLRGGLSVLKWLFVAATAILLVTCLILRAPYKVNILLSILLITPTLIPKKIRKYIYITYCLIVIISVIWILLPENDEGWTPVTCQAEIDAFIANHAIAEEQNAASIYNELYTKYDGDKYIPPDFSNFDENSLKDANSVELVEMLGGKTIKGTFYPDFWDEDLNEITLHTFWASEDHPDLAKWIDSKQDAVLRHLFIARQREACNFPFEISDTSPANTIYAALKHWAMLLIRAGNNAVADGNFDEALEYYGTVYKMTGHLYQQPDTFYYLIGTAVESMANKRLRAIVLLENLPVDYIDKFAALLVSVEKDLSDVWPDLLQTQKLTSKNIQLAFYETNSDGKVRFARGNSVLFENYLATFSGYSKPQTYWQARGYKTGAFFAWFWMPSTPQKMSQIIEDSYSYYNHRTMEEWMAIEEEFSFRSARLNYGGVIKMLQLIYDPSMRRICLYNLRNRSHRNSTYLVFALSRYKNTYGNWPKSLSELKVLPELLIDPVNNGSFVYKLTDDSFTLYSKGENGVDDGGIRDSINNKDDYDVFWPLKQPNRLNKPPTLIIRGG